jgi:quercetin dioxygenase-like cupin family protein
MNNLDFTTLQPSSGIALDLSADGHPTLVRHLAGGAADLDPAATHYGMVTAGSCTLHDSYSSHTLRAGMFFVCPGSCSVECGNMLIVSILNYVGLWQIGGPLEPLGRLKYIDGCTDTLLVSPPRLGEPCLNHLHIPPNTSQSQHTHPSVRIGVILRGSGECRTSEGVCPLTAGMAWYIPTGCLHSFYTSDDSMDVIAWHPDSDFGPTDENHPMVNRTILK